MKAPALSIYRREPTIPPKRQKSFLSTTSPWKFSRRFSFYVQEDFGAGMSLSAPPSRGVGERHYFFAKFVAIGERSLYLYHSFGVHCRAPDLSPHILHLSNSGLPALVDCRSRCPSKRRWSMTTHRNITHMHPKCSIYSRMRCIDGARLRSL